MPSKQPIEVRPCVKRPPDDTHDGAESGLKKRKSGNCHTSQPSLDSSVLQKSIPPRTSTKPQFSDVSYLLPSRNAVEESPPVSPFSKPSAMNTPAPDMTLDPPNSPAWIQADAQNGAGQPDSHSLPPASHAFTQHGGEMVQQEMDPHDKSFTSQGKSAHTSLALSGSLPPASQDSSTAMCSGTLEVVPGSHSSANYVNGNHGPFRLGPVFVDPACFASNNRTKPSHGRDEP